MNRRTGIQQEILVNSYLIFLCTRLGRETARAARARHEAAVTVYGKVDLGLVIDSGAAAGSLGYLNLKADGD